MTMNDHSLKRKIAELAADSSRVIVLPHAKQRMKKRRILLTQVLHCLPRKCDRTRASGYQGVLEVHP
jgi:hypothetical protein